MKKKLIITPILCLFSILIIGQTKLISHKSHSGTNSSFALALKSEKSPIKESNFGMAPQRFVRNSNLDSVILINEKVAIMITSESCHYEEYGNSRDRSGKNIWSAGRDTVFNHPVFTSKNTLKDIKRTLKDEYYFQNEIDSVVFIGFEGDTKKYYPNNTPKIKQLPKNDLAQKDEKEENSPRRPKSLFLIFLISIYSAICNCHF